MLDKISTGNQKHSLNEIDRTFDLGAQNHKFRGNNGVAQVSSVRLRRSPSRLAPEPIAGAAGNYVENGECVPWDFSFFYAHTQTP